MSVLMIDRLRAIADRDWTGVDMARTLRKAADTMENQQNHIRALQKELHEVKSELDAAIAGQETLQRHLAKYTEGKNGTPN